MNIYFLSDNSINLFYCAVFSAYKDGGNISSRKDIQLALGDNIVNVAYDEEKCVRIRNAVAKYDGNAENDIMLALRSRDNDREQKIFEYLKQLFKVKKTVKNHLSLNEVVEFNDLLYKVIGELHRLKGFLRFIECDNGILYAPCSPDNNIVDLLASHFKKRLAAEKFIIHDVNRRIATLYDGKKLLTGNVGTAEIYVSEEEKRFENLWKRYYKAVNIESRPHEKQMKGYMPVRYWKFLPEKQD